VREKKKFFFCVFFSCLLCCFCVCVLFLFVVVVDFFFCLCNDEKLKQLFHRTIFTRNRVSLSTPRIHYIILEEKSRERDERDERDERVFCCCCCCCCCCC